MEQNRVEFEWSFYISWAGQIISFIEVVLLYVISWTSSRVVKEQYIAERNAAYQANLANAGIKDMQQVWG